MSSVVVVKVGAATPVGLNAIQTGFLLRAGLPAMAEAPLGNAAGEPITMGFLPTLDPRLTGAERLAQLSQAPFEEAVSSVHDMPAEVYVSIDEELEEGALASQLLSARIKRAMPQAKLRVEARGEAGPGSHLPAAIRALESRLADVAVIGGAHTDYDVRAIVQLEASGRLFSRENLDARIPGEAAAFFVLMRGADAARRGLAPLARITGIGAGRESARPDNDDPAFAASGLTEAVREATETLLAEGSAAGWMFTDLTGEMRRLYEWQAMFTRSQKALGRPYIIESPAQRIGYLGAAALPLFVAIAATAWQHEYAPSPIALATAGTDSGSRAAILIREA